jgi:hypothetical protein
MDEYLTAHSLTINIFLSLCLEVAEPNAATDTLCLIEAFVGRSQVW